MTIDKWFRQAADRLAKQNIASARLDALILLEDELGKDKAWILAHPEHNLSAENAKTLDELVNRRKKGEPLAYIRGFVEFYGRNFSVTPNVLIPRPETEAIIELAKRLDLPDNSKAIDVGTGSGCIAITLKLEHPSWQVNASDISETALDVAKQNASNLGADITFSNSDLNPKPLDLIVANLPYVDTTWETRGIDFEPHVALYAEDNGLALIKKLIIQASEAQKPGSYLILEADPRQHDDIITFAHAHNYTWYATEGYGIVFQKG